MAKLVVFAGLPGSGKSSVAQELARVSGAAWLRIDSMEQAIRESGVAPGSLDDAGYRVAYAVAEDNLRLGHDVVADSVNPWMLTRDAWRAVADQAAAKILEVETVCVDAAEHRRRVEGRKSSVPGLELPDWHAVLTRDYHPWDRDRLILDTASLSIPASVQTVLAALQRLDV